LEQELIPGAAPAFERIKYCLIWPDERPDGLSPAGQDLVADLWVARGLIHRGTPIDRYPSYFDSWNGALVAQLGWNGFTRIALTLEQRTVLDEALARPDPDFL